MQQRKGVLLNNTTTQPTTLAHGVNASKRGRGSGSKRTSIVMMLVLAVPVLALGILFLASRHVQPSSLHHHRANNIERQAVEDIGTGARAGSSNNKNKNTKNNASGGGEKTTNVVEYHIVFSTGCSAYQDWQSFLFFHQAWKSGQPGTVTRIVSGCSPEEQVTLQRLFDDQIAPMLQNDNNNDNDNKQQRFAIHFTPDYSRVKPEVNYKYFNKPYGMKHWMENALGFPDNPQNEEAIVILLDPDQLIIRPFVDNNFTNTAWKFIPANETPYSRIEHGRPMGQMYGFYLQWKSKINMKLVLQDPEHADELPSPVDALTDTQAQRGYIVGPPYIATARDMYQIVCKWSQFAPKVHDQYPYLLAEMFAYCLAAAHVQLPHQTAASFMVSDISSGAGEGWKPYVDIIPNDQVCDTSPARHKEEWPNVIHFCQRYGWGPYFFGKHRLPKTFLTCASPLLVEPPSDLLQKYDVMYMPPHDEEKQLNKMQAKRSVFVLCHLIPALNAAAEYYKRNHCIVTPPSPNDATTKLEEIANFQKTLIFSHKLEKGSIQEHTHLFRMPKCVTLDFLSTGNNNVDIHMCWHVDFLLYLEPSWWMPTRRRPPNCICIEFGTVYTALWTSRNDIGTPSVCPCGIIKGDVITHVDGEEFHRTVLMIYSSYYIPWQRLRVNNNSSNPK